MAVRNLLIRGGADFSAMNSGLNNAQQRLTRFQRNVNSIMSKVAAVFATIKIGELVKNGVQDAMSVETSIENLNRTLQDSSKNFQNWANSQAQSYGMSTQEAYKYGSTFSNLISSFQSDSTKIANSTQELMKATAIVASKTGRTFEDASERIRSGMLGSTEAIEDLGIYTNVSMIESTEAFNKFAKGKSWKQLDFQTQQQIRLAAILEQAYARYGDTLADTTQSRHNQFIASLKNVQLALGQAFLPIYNAVLPPLTAFMNMLSRAISVISMFTTAIFGKPTTIKQQAKATTDLSNSVSNLSTAANSADNSLKKASSSTKKAATEAKKAKKEIGGLIGGLDEINNLSVSTTAGTSGSSGSSSNPSTSTSTPSVGGLGNLDAIDMGESIDTSGLEAKAEKIKKIFDKIRKVISDNKDIIISLMTGLMAGLGVVLISKWGRIGAFFTRNFPVLSKIFSKLGKVIFKPFSLLKQGFKALLGLNPIVLAVVVVITTLVSALTYLWRTNKDFRDKVIKTWKTIKDTLQPWLEGFWTIFKVLADIVGTILVAAFKLIGKVIVKVVEVLANGFMDSILEDAPKLKEMGENFKKFAKNIEKGWKYVKKLGFAKTMEILLNKLKKVIKEKLKDIKDEFIKKVKDYFKEMKEKVQEKWEDITDSVKDFIINIGSEIEDFKEKAQEKWEDIQDWVKDKFVEIGTKFTETKENLKKKWDDLTENVKDKVADMKANVANKWSDLKDKWSSISDNIKDKTADMKAKIANRWSDLKSKWGEISNNIKDKTADMKAKIATKWNDIKARWQEISNNVKGKTADFKAKLATKWSDLKERWSGISSNIKGKTVDMKAKVATKWSDLKDKWSNLTKNFKNKTMDFKVKLSTAAGNVKNFVNNIIKEVNNKLIAKLDFSFKAPSWLGGATWGWKAPRIPYLAKGGIIDSATLAVVGEQGREAVMPLENNTGWITDLAGKISSRMGGTGQQEVYNGDVIIKLDGNTVLKQSVVSILRQMKRQGITI